MKTDDEMTLTELVARYPGTWDHHNLHSCEMCAKRAAILARRRNAPCCTADHKVLTDKGWAAIGEVVPSEPQWPCGHGERDYRTCERCRAIRGEQAVPAPNVMTPQEVNTVALGAAVDLYAEDVERLTRELETVRETVDREWSVAAVAALSIEQINALTRELLRARLLPKESK